MHPEWNSSDETEFWRSQPGIREDLEEARREIAEGRTIPAEEMKDRISARLNIESELEWAERVVRHWEANGKQARSATEFWDESGID